jgi:hypothetical protein
MEMTQSSSSDGRCAVSDLPTKRSKAAGFRSSKELSSFSGVRHFWQYILATDPAVLAVQTNGYYMAVLAALKERMIRGL